MDNFVFNRDTFRNDLREIYTKKQEELSKKHNAVLFSRIVEDLKKKLIEIASSGEGTSASVFISQDDFNSFNSVLTPTEFCTEASEQLGLSVTYSLGNYFYGDNDRIGTSGVFFYANFLK